MIIITTIRETVTGKGGEASSSVRRSAVN
jgi:hypothetical protein